MGVDSDRFSSSCKICTLKKLMINKILKGILTFCYVAGVLLVFAGLFGPFNNNKNLAVTLVTLGAILCLFSSFVSYREAIKKNDRINTQKAFSRLVAILVGLGLALLRLFFRR